MKTLFRILLIISAEFLCASLSAQPFVADQNGYVRDAKFKDFIKAKGYLLVGKFYSRRVNTRYGDAYDIVLARAYKGGPEVYIDLNGNEVAYDPVSPIVFETPPVSVDDEPELIDNYTKRHPYVEFSKNGKYGTKKGNQMRLAWPLFTISCGTPVEIFSI